MSASLNENELEEMRGPLVQRAELELEEVDIAPRAAGPRQQEGLRSFFTSAKRTITERRWLIVIGCVLASIIVLLSVLLTWRGRPKTVGGTVVHIESLEGFTFAVIGDWGRKGAHHQAALGRVMGQVCASSRAPCEFTISVGDNFYDDGVDSTTDHHWKTSFEKIYDAPSLQRRWYIILGNHDYRGTPQAQLDYAAISDRWHLPARYYTEEVLVPLSANGTGPSLRLGLFFIDTTPMLSEYRSNKKYMKPDLFSQDVAGQLEWLKGALAASKADWKILVGHHPVYSLAGTHGDTQELQAAIGPLLGQHRVDAYICGHDHNLQHIAKAEQPRTAFFVSGAGSECRDDLLHGSPELRFGTAETSFFTFTFVGPRTLRATAYQHDGSAIYQADVVKQY
eukprot:tig00000882_g5266.t1